MPRFSDYLKNIFWVILIINFLPGVFSAFRKYTSDFWETKTKVGVVSIGGMITSSDRYAAQLKKFFKNPEIKAIVLKIDSPGGAPGAAQALYQEIRDLKKEHVKTVIAYSENLCASAAYYIACAADHIITQPSTLVGSIGVFIGYPNLQEFIEQYKIKYTTIQSGDYKAAGLLFKDLTPQQRSMLQSITDDTYKQFVQDVAARRPKVATVDPKVWADGKTLSGQQALKLGLIDEIGSQTALAKALKKKAPIEGEITWVHPAKPGVFASLFGKEEEESDDDQNASVASSWTSSCVKALFDRLSSPIYM